jgi:hypothetical protein
MMKSTDLKYAKPAENAALRVAWPFFFSAGPFWRTVKRAWPKAQPDVTRKDMVSIFAADLKESNDIMVKHHRETTPQAEANP